MVVLYRCLPVMQDAYRDFTQVKAGLATLSELQLCVMQVCSFMAAMRAYNALLGTYRHSCLVRA